MARAKTLLITGSSGFIGQHVCAQALLQGHRVRGIDLRPDPRAEFSSRFQTQFTTEVRDAASLTREDFLEVDAVIHLAATVSVPQCEEHPVQSTDNNLRLVVHLLEATPASVPLVFASSSAVYGDAGAHHRQLKEEDASPWPLSYYAAQKRTAEMFLQIACQNHNRKAIALRFFNVYGFGQDPSSPYSGVLSRFLSLMDSGQAISIHGDGSQTRDFVAVQDVVYAILRSAEILEKRPFSTFSVLNVGTGCKTAIKDLPTLLGEALGKTPCIDFGSPRLGDVKDSCADLTRARAELGPLPETPLNIGLEAFVRAWRSSR